MRLEPGQCKMASARLLQFLLLQEKTKKKLVAAVDIKVAW